MMCLAGRQEVGIGSKATQGLPIELLEDFRRRKAGFADLADQLLLRLDEFVRVGCRQARHERRVAWNLLVHGLLRRRVYGKAYGRLLAMFIPPNRFPDQAEHRSALPLAHIQPGSVQAAPNRGYAAKTLACLIGVEIEEVADCVEGIAGRGLVMKNPDQGVPLHAFDSACRFLG
jgi:hypothetical protein